MVVFVGYEKVKSRVQVSHRAPGGGTRNAEVFSGVSQMTRNPAELIGQLCSRTGRFPWFFLSLNLDRSHSELATVWSLVEILYASSCDRICLFRT